MVQRLLSLPSLCVNALDNKGRTALALAIYHQHLEVASMLNDHDRNSRFYKLHWAAQHGYLQVGNKAQDSSTVWQLLHVHALDFCTHFQSKSKMSLLVRDCAATCQLVAWPRVLCSHRLRLQCCVCVGCARVAALQCTARPSR